MIALELDGVTRDFATPDGGTYRAIDEISLSIENPGRIPMVFIEVQTGSYVGEDDIVRYEDRYARN